MEPKETKTRGNISDTPCPKNITGKHSWRSISSQGRWAEQECRFCQQKRETVLAKPLAKRGKGNQWR